MGKHTAPNLPWRFSCALLALLALLVSCGYRPVAGSGGGKTLTVYMPMWANQTSEMGLDALIFQAIADRFKRTGRVRLIPSPEGADYELSGTVLTLLNPGLSYGTADQAKELNAQLAVGFNLKERASGALLLDEKGYALAKPYFVGNDAVRTRSNRRQVLNNMAEELAEEILQRILDLSLER